MSTVAVVGACAPNYYEWLPQWVASIECLRRKPDDVVLCAWPDAPVPAWVRLVDPPQQDWAWAPWHNTAARASEGDYVAHIGVDDHYYPCALDGADGWTADVVVFGMEWQGGGRFGAWVPNRETIAAGDADYVPCGSPIRRSVFDRVGGWHQHLFPAVDWALWVGAATVGASFRTTDRADFWYRAHDATPKVHEEDKVRMMAWAATL